MSFVILFSCIVAYWEVLKFFVKRGISKLAEKISAITDEIGEKFTKEQKIAFVILALLFLFLFLPGILLKETALYYWLNKVSTTGIVAFFVLAVGLIKVDGKRLADFASLAKEGIVWDLILVFVVIMPVSSAMVREETGILAR